MAVSKVLEHDVETLAGLLEQALVEQTGSTFTRRLSRMRQLARERRLGLPGAEERLAEMISTLSEDELNQLVRALSISFDLANLAEDLQRIRVLREREKSAGDAPRRESLGDAIARLKTAGVPAAKVQALLDRLHIGLVFTAHPTEAKRRTTRRVLRQMRSTLTSLERPNLLPREAAEAKEAILGGMTLLWQVDPMRPQAPTVMQEVERGLFFFDGLWEIIPRLMEDMRTALTANYPGFPFRVSPFVKFGSWIGGDRDGNPFVTASVTEKTLGMLQAASLDRHVKVSRKLAELLVMSGRNLPANDPLLEAVQAAATGDCDATKVVQAVAEVEPFRRWLKVIELRLEATRSASELKTNVSSGATKFAPYRNVSQLAADVKLLADGLSRMGGDRVADTYVSGWLDQIRTFGLQVAALDVRQDSRVHVDVLTELFAQLGLHPAYNTADEATRQKLLLAEPPHDKDLFALTLADMSKETLSLFQLLAKTVREGGAERLGGHVISMTHYPSDILAVLWFWRWAWKSTLQAGDSAQPTYLPIVPLFETIDDLHRGPEVLDVLLQFPLYREYLQSAQQLEMTQIVMVGYSDSTKDGGYLAASWGLYRAQQNLALTTAKHGARLVLFHGRGGALGRGGGPAARALMSLPPESVGGALRMTEQGEVLAERYDDPQIAFRHMEQVTWATVLVSGQPVEKPDENWFTLLDGLAEKSFRHYRQLVEEPGFLVYFDRATPISEIERLPIGSRPARRRERRSLSDLRAIPWTFAWTQSRHLIPAWYGLGMAITDAVNTSGGDWTVFQTMYKTWPLFQAVIDNAALALSKADLTIAQRYAELVDDGDGGKQVWSLISTEFDRSKASVLMITGEQALLAGTPWLQQSILERNPTVDPLNLIQIELLKRLRAKVAAGDLPAAERLQQSVRLTIQGVASGLRTTG